MSQVPALVLTGPGSNREHEAAFALERAGAHSRIVSVCELAESAALLRDAALLVIAGGFSYGDALGSGRLLALDIQTRLAVQFAEFVARERPVLGICNGFQTLIRAGVLPGALGHNGRGRFECRWVTLAPTSTRCIWTSGLDEPITCPVAHGEGRYVIDDEGLTSLFGDDRVALTYTRPDAKPADGSYPYNPNGSMADIAGVCDERGLVLGLMPHPEDHVIGRQHPRATRGESRGLGLRLFESGVKHARTS